ncbi:MAG: hypothetical protein ACYTBJ_16890 [Planctomycetota bacterium]|jgi:predicted outer membrane repeat protein
MKAMKTTIYTICLVAALLAGSALAANHNVPQDYPNIQAAIDAAEDSDTVIVAPGTYTGAGNCRISLRGKKITVCSTNPSDPQIVSATVIDGQGRNPGFLFYSGETAESKLAGLTITNGYYFLGGAVYCYNNSSPEITGCVMVNNSATFGGAIACAGAGSIPRITNCQIKANSAMVSGGAIYCNTGSPIIKNCILSGNYAPQGGAVYGHNAANAVLGNCTVAANKAAQRAGGAYFLQGCNASLTNTIFWADNAAYAAEILVGNSGTPASITVSYCDIEKPEASVVSELGCTVNWGEGNVDVDPCFVQVAFAASTKTSDGGDYHLLTSSGCIDAGDPLFVTAPGETDIDGEPRVAGKSVEIGADEREAAIQAIQATVDAKPETINLAGNSKYVGCSIRLPEGYDVVSINVSSVELNGTFAAVSSVVDEVEHKLLVKFERSQLDEILTPDSPVLLVITGNLNDGTPFEGSDTIRVRSAGGNGNSKKNSSRR